MIKLAICDDEQIQIDNLNKLVCSWAKEFNLRVNTTHYTSAESFLFCYEEEKNFDILLLDIEMGEVNGVELAKRIRKDNERIQIIFITAFADFIAEGYDVSALHYLMKPVSKEKLFEVLNKAVERIKRQDKPLLTDNIKINPSEIAYIEAFARSCEIKLISGERVTSMAKISTLEGELNGDFCGEFIRCHRSYIVGIRHIKQITKTELLLDSGDVLPLSRRLYVDVNKAFISFFKGE